MIGCMLLATVSFAQNPAWAKKAANAVFTLKTFNADGSLLASVNGFFINEQGMAVSSFTPFKNAYRAVIIDAQGKEMEVDCLTGYNDMYDVAKFQVLAKKTQALNIAQSPAGNGATLWLLPYAVKKVPTCTKGTVKNAEQFGEGYTYYTLDMTTTDQQMGCPILNEQGEVAGILQPSASGNSTTGYAVSARFANSLQMVGLSLSDPVLRSVKIAKALPDDQGEATLTLYVSSSTMDAEEFNRLIEQFIEKLNDCHYNLKKKYGIISLRLFGSMARNEQKSDSDIDLFVETETPNPFLLMDAKEYIENSIGRPVDIIRNHRNLNPRLRKRIERDGITIF